MKIKKHNIYKYQGNDIYLDNKRFLFYKKSNDILYEGGNKIVVWNTVCLDIKRNEILQIPTHNSHLDESEWKLCDYTFELGDIIYYKKPEYFEISKFITARNEKIVHNKTPNKEFGIMNGYVYLKDCVYAKLILCDVSGYVLSSNYYIPIQYIEKR